MADSSSSLSSYTKIRRGCSMIPERFQLHLSMVGLQFGYAGFHVVSRTALNMGISKIVFPVYRNILALILLLPFAYFMEKKERPPLTWSFIIQFFLLAIVGITANQGFYLLGLDHTSPTFASAIQNSVPAITFLMAALLRIEQVRLDRKDGISKVVGTVFCVAGATVITLYKGPTIYSPSSSSTTITGSTAAAAILRLGDDEGSNSSDRNKNWTLGCLYLIGHCLSWSGWLVLQAPVVKKYPARLSFTSYQCFFGIIQFLAIAAFLERTPQAWLVRTRTELFSVFYAGVVASGIAFAVQIWCIDRGGPVFVAVYQPVQTLLVAILSSFLLQEQFYLGGIIGAVLVIIGLYLVLWGHKLDTIQRSAAEQGGDATASSAAAAAHIKASSITQPLLYHSTV
ncbi:protein WALLS ARE THIN 1-like isoform X2 [Andrographis paniculata]|uniref:protein WALLS ARE THIN 1-like isoform X2 n=1 Tax=Andrographis paniculata TaxID=175694 RepID=UPI0021E6E176|nr:protein WALLS ARE THIN 1-like isoform X2 [Andrographis paniculata]